MPSEPRPAPTLARRALYTRSTPGNRQRGEEGAVRRFHQATIKVEGRFGGAGRRSLIELRLGGIEGGQGSRDGIRLRSWLDAAQCVQGCVNIGPRGSFFGGQGIDWPAGGFQRVQRGEPRRHDLQVVHQLGGFEAISRLLAQQAHAVGDENHAGDGGDQAPANSPDDI